MFFRLKKIISSLKISNLFCTFKYCRLDIIKYFMQSSKKITSKEKDSILNPMNWELTKVKDRLYTSDHLIDAYIQGKNVSLDEEKKILIKTLVENVDKAGEYTQILISYMKKEVGFSPISAHLKINNVTDFQVLIFLPTSEFLNESIFALYSKISESEKSIYTDYFKIHTSIGNTKNDINKDCLLSDGYSLHFKM